MHSKRINASLITILRGDLTEMETDAIVNAANQYLKHGGGVAGAIVRKGGQAIQDESNKIGYTPVGTAVVTKAGNLKTRFVIHAVGPRMGEGNEDIKLKQATENSLKLALENNLKTIAFPAISTGIFGYPIERCAKIMLETCKQFLKNTSKPMEIFFCLWTESDFNEFNKVLNIL